MSGWNGPRPRDHGSLICDRCGRNFERDIALRAADTDPSPGAVGGMAALLVLCVAVALAIAVFWAGLLWVLARA